MTLPYNSLKTFKVVCLLVRTARPVLGSVMEHWRAGMVTATSFLVIVVGIEQITAIVLASEFPKVGFSIGAPNNGHMGARSDEVV